MIIFYILTIIKKHCGKIFMYISDGGKHDFKSLTSLKVEVNDYLRGKLEGVSQKIDKVYSLDKKAWRELDIQEEKCGDTIIEIERVRDEMVRI